MICINDIYNGFQLNFSVNHYMAGVLEEAVINVDVNLAGDFRL